MTTLWIIVGTWIVVALVAAFWVGAAMRHAEHGEQCRLDQERAQEPAPQQTPAVTPTGTDDVRTA